jgi:hypothetical protein
VLLEDNETNPEKFQTTPALRATPPPSGIFFETAILKKKGHQSQIVRLGKYNTVFYIDS